MDDDFLSLRSLARSVRFPGKRPDGVTSASGLAPKERAQVVSVLFALYCPEVSTRGPMTNDDRQSRSVLRHPLVIGIVLTLLSGILASLIIPALTRSWQDRPLELALKRELVERISTAATDTVEAASFYGFNIEFARGRADSLYPSAKRFGFLLPAVKKWEIDSSSIESELATYFHGSGLPAQWQAYEFAVQQFLRYTVGAEKELSNSQLENVRDHFRTVSFDSATAEETRRSFVTGTSADRPRIVVAELLLDERDQIERRIVGADASGFSHGFWILG